MRLEKLSVRGFRGFNEERTIRFHERLTVINAPNSHGKTSIVEALEFLIFGSTSKVERADSKDEYKDSYRNKHTPANEPSRIVLTLRTEADERLVLSCEIDSRGVLTRFVNDAIVTQWPFSDDIEESARPFVVQHALKAILLAKPSDRFATLAKLLGLTDVARIQSELVSLCTKPESQISGDATRYLSSLESLIEAANRSADLAELGKALGNTSEDPEAVLETAHALADVLAPMRDGGTALSRLIAARDERTARLIPFRPGLQSLDRPLQAQADKAVSSLATRQAQELVATVGVLATADAIGRLQREHSFLHEGLARLAEDPTQCPLCRQAVDASTVSSFNESRVAAVEAELKQHAHGAPSRESLIRDLAATRDTVDELLGRLEAHCQAFTRIADSSLAPKWVDVLQGTDPSVISSLTALAEEISQLLAGLRGQSEELETATATLSAQIQSQTETIAAAEEAAAKSIALARALELFCATLNRRATEATGSLHVLTQAIDARAGTLAISTLIRVLERPGEVKKALALRNFLSGLKTLKRVVEQKTAAFMEQSLDTDLTNSVLAWYDKLRTASDPDVHFDGFSMERTKSGDYKSGRVGIGASSYGAKLASAVSSLSESKLNALGLCVSIATSIDNPGPWRFLVLDDPIQSWDADHESQFIAVLREIAEDHSRQIVLLSHRDEWTKRVQEQCRSVGGIRYSIAGYDLSGPRIREVAWMPVDDRIRKIRQTCEDVESDELQLQAAEEDVRIAVTDLTAEACRTKLKRQRDGSQLGGRDVRALLSEMKCPDKLIDRVCASFSTTDDSHHAPTRYSVNRERLRSYHGMLLELKQWMRSGTESAEG